MTKKWKELDEKYPGIFESIWAFPRRGEGGDGKFHGNFVPQIPERLMALYTKPGDPVIDPFAGSGTTIDVGARMGREVWAYDLNPTRDDIEPGDACDIQITPLQTFKLAILHPPYHSIVKFSDDPRDLSNCHTIGDFLWGMEKVAVGVDIFVRSGGWLALVIGDIYASGQIVPLGHLTSMIWTQNGISQYDLKRTIIKDIQGNKKGSRGRNENMWKSRHARNGTGFFSHEYIFVFKKT